MHYPLQYFRDGPRDFSHITRGVDDMDAIWLAHRSGEVSCAHAFKERAFLAFEPIALCAAISDALVAELNRQVEQYRKIRTQLLLHPRFYFSDAIDGHSSPAALVRIRSVSKAIANYRLARGQRRTDNLRDMRGPRRKH